MDVVTLEPGGPPSPPPGETAHQTGNGGDFCQGLAGFRRQGRLHRLRAVEGPERLECEWWREKAPRRDYYLVKDEMGCRYWLLREGGEGSEAMPRWFLHGIFG